MTQRGQKKHRFLNSGAVLGFGHDKVCASSGFRRWPGHRGTGIARGSSPAPARGTSPRGSRRGCEIGAARIQGRPSPPGHAGSNRQTPLRLKRLLLPSAAFVRSGRRFARKHPQTVSELQSVLALLTEDAFHPQLKTHKLKGKLTGSWACSAGYDLRVGLRICEAQGRRSNPAPKRRHARRWLLIELHLPEPNTKINP